jgi:hypothetical protein
MAVGSDVEIHTRHTDTLLTEHRIFLLNLVVNKVTTRL